MPPININLNSALATTIQASSTLISSVVNGFIVSPNNAPPGVSGFVFQIIDDEEMFVDSDITDNFVEQNYATQDHVALKPIHFTLKGLMGELAYLVGQPYNPILSSVLALAPLAVASPEFNIQDSQVYSAIALESAQAVSILNQIPSISSLIANLSNIQTQQQAAFNFFLSLRNNRQLVTIQTPYGLLTNYFIENFRSLQPGDSRFMSHFTVTFKQIQVVSTAVSPTASSPNPSGSGSQTTDNSDQNNPPANTVTTLPSQTQFSDDPTQPSDSSGRLNDYTTDLVPEGNTSGVTAVPDTTPAIPVTVPNIFPTTNPVFETAPLLNSPTPGFIPA